MSAFTSQGRLKKEGKTFNLALAPCSLRPKLTREPLATATSAHVLPAIRPRDDGKR